MRKFSVFSVLTFFCLVFANNLSAQDYLLGSPPAAPGVGVPPITGKKVTLCDDRTYTFTDDGGGTPGTTNPGNNYKLDNMNDSIEFVSSLGDKGVIEAVFTDFFTDPNDTLFIWSVDNAGNRVTLLDKLSNNQRLTISAGTPSRYYSDPGGIAAGIRFIFVTNATVRNPGWVVKIREASATPAQGATVDLLSITGDPFVTLGNGVIGVCSNTTLDLDAVTSTGNGLVNYPFKSFGNAAVSQPYPYTPDPTAFSYAWTSNEPNSNNTRVWNRPFATKASFTFTVNITTDKCRALDTTLRVNVSTVPDFTGTSGDQFVCQGNTVQITGVATGTQGTNFDTPPTSYTYTPIVTADEWVPVAGNPAAVNPTGVAVTRVPSGSPAPPAGVYQYVFIANDNYGCTYTDTIDVTVSNPVNAGTDATDTVCASSNAYGLMGYLGSGVVNNATGIWTDMDGSGNLTDNVNGIVDLLGIQTDFMAPNLPRTFRFKYHITGNPGCPDDEAIVTLTVYPSANSGSDVTINSCNTACNIDLLSILGTDQDKGTWDAPTIGGGVITGNTLCLTTGGNPSINPPGYVGTGTYTYEYTTSYPGTNPGCNDVATVTINVYETGVAGQGQNIDVCSTDAPINLFPLLTGNPDDGSEPGETVNWSINAPGTITTSFGSKDATFDPAAQTANGVYNAVFEVRKNDPVCPDSTATIKINFQIAPNAGTANALRDTCTGPGNLDLFKSLSGSYALANGNWSDDDNIVTQSGARNELVDLNSVNFSNGKDTITGHFTYTVSTTNTICNTSSTTVLVRFTRASYAGTDRSIVVCENSGSFFLKDSIGNPLPNVTTTWSGGTGYTPANNSARFDPNGVPNTTQVITATDTAKGPGCVTKTATLTITINEKPEAGLDSDTAKVCETETTYELAPLLDPAVVTTPTGFWTLQGGANADWLNRNSGVITMDNVTLGFPGCGGKLFFEYHDTAVNCLEDISLHSLDVKCTPNAGPDSTVSVCSTDPTFDLFQYFRTPDQSGKYVDVDGSAGLVNPANYLGKFNPSLVQTTDTFRIAYVVQNLPCDPADTAYLSVYLSRRPKAGQGDTARVCEDIEDFDLYQGLTGTYDRKGKWKLEMLPPYDTTFMNTEVNGNLSQYFTGADGNLFNVKKFLEVSENSNTPFFKFRSGTQEKPYVRLRYTVTDTSGIGPNPPICADSSVIVILKISKLFPTPSQKTNNYIQVCQQVCTYNLQQNLLNNFDFYAYTDQDKLSWTSTKPVSISNDSLLAPCSMAPGKYDFTMKIQTEACPEISLSPIKLEIVAPANAGVSNDTTVCETSGSISIAAITGGDVGGTITYTGTNPPSMTNGVGSSTYTPNAGQGPGTFIFTYKVNSAVCGNTSTAIATINVLGSPATTGDQSVTICYGTKLPLSSVVGATFPGTTFTTAGGACKVALPDNTPLNQPAVFDGSIAPFAGGATCVITGTADNGVCPPVTTQIFVTIAARPNSGLDYIDTICSTESAYDLSTNLGGGLAGNGTFSVGSGGILDARLEAAPDTIYGTYITKTDAVCPNDTANFALFIEKAPSAGTDAFVELCGADTTILLTSLLNGTVAEGGFWTPENPAWYPFMAPIPTYDILKVGNLYDGYGPGVYRFTYTVHGVKCADDVSTLTIRLVEPPKSGNDTTIYLCTSNTSYDLNTALGNVNSYDVGGTWRDNGGVTTPLINPSSYGARTVKFTYTVGSTVCPASTTTVTAIFNDPPKAGADRADTVYLCDKAQVDLNIFLPASAQNGGQWSVHNGSSLLVVGLSQYNGVAGDAGKKGVLKYVVTAQGCPADSAFYKYRVSTTQTTPADPNVAVCNTNVAINLKGYFPGVFGEKFTLEAQNGTRNQQAIDAGALVNDSMFYPNLAGNGKYVFTVRQANYGCGAVNSTLTMNVVGPGIDTAFTACVNGDPIDLNVVTKSTDIVGGTWSAGSGAPANLISGNVFFPANGVAGTTYTNVLTTNITGCKAQAKITIVNVLSITNTAGTAPTYEIICYPAQGKYQVKFVVKGGQAPYSISPADPADNFNTTTGVFTSRMLNNGAKFAYLFNSAAGCGTLEVVGSNECGDNDNDGVFDFTDLDDDNDGIPDSVEAEGLADANGDNNGDGVPNYKDVNYCTSVGGTVSNSVCSKYDFDGDGIINQRDLDSDNDSISDLFEGFSTQMALTFEGSNINGIVTPFTDVAVPKDGWHDDAATFFTSGGKAVKTSPARYDFLALDSDRDSIADYVEGGRSISVAPINTDGASDGYDFRDTDSDNDKVHDKFENGRDGDLFAVPNSDNDTIPDFRDTDSDNDGMADGVDSKVTMITETPEDFDGDGLYNFQDPDSDNDNIADIIEKGKAANANTNPAKTCAANTTPDYTNLDSDCDRICDIYEGHANGLGLLDPVSDVDSDGTFDYADLDSDGDGILDEIETKSLNCAAPTDTDGDGIYDARETDSDADGMNDRFEARKSKSSPEDTDGDGLADFQDTDSDGDCIPDKVEARADYDVTFVAGKDTAYMFLKDGEEFDYQNLDSDGDGLLDSQEAGPDCGNPVDSDGDGFPNFRDLDSDNDGVTDRMEKDADCDGDGNPNYIDQGDNCDITTFVPEGFSPNGDGVNDFFVIADIAEFPKASLQVYNRWGGLVFESSKYDNRWNGTYKGEEVPQGTYFYLLDLGIGKAAQKGYIYINR